MKEVVLVHGWLSSPKHHWFPWLKKELTGRKYKVTAPAMPNPMRPEKEKWVSLLKAKLKGRDPSQTTLIGHSLGTPTILYALQDHKGPSFEHVILVGAFARRIPNLELVTKGYDMHFDIDDIMPKAKKWTIIHGDDDPLVPFREGEWLAKRLGADFIVEKGRGHLTQYRGVFKLKSVLDSITEGQALSAEIKESIKPATEKFITLESALEAILGLVKK